MNRERTVAVDADRLTEGDKRVLNLWAEKRLRTSRGDVIVPVRESRDAKNLAVLLEILGH